MTLLSVVREASLMLSDSQAVSWSDQANFVTFSLTQYPVSPGTATQPSLLAASDEKMHQIIDSFSENVRSRVRNNASIYCNT